MLFRPLWLVAALLALVACEVADPQPAAESYTAVVLRGVTDTSVADTSVADTSVADTSVPDTSVPANALAADEGAIATVHPLATQAATNAFAKGGNAVDAAIAAALTLGVVNSHNSGIGGGCFILARLASGEIIALDGREMAPARATPDMYRPSGVLQPELSKVGALASGVPGSVAAFAALQALAGKLTLAELLEPAAELAEQGFAVDQTLALRLASTAETLAKFPATAAIFMPNGEPLKAGETLVQKDLAASYRALARHGPQWFYGGEFAARTATWMAAHGGLLTQTDFANYELKWRTPIASRFMGYTVYGFPPPSSGGIHVAQILRMTEALNVATLAPADYYHVLAEAMKLAFADRAVWLGDPDFVPVPEGLLAEAYLHERAQRIQLQRAATEVLHGKPEALSQPLFDRHTTHIAAADSAGNWLAITTTLNTSFGSKVVIPGTGVLLNNQMDDFALEPGVANAFGLVGNDANAIAPAKRPLSSMSPTLVLHHDQPVLTLGAAGGPTIISQVVQVLIQHLARAKPLPDAMAAARIHHQWRPPQLFVEADLPAPVQAELVRRGHELKPLGAFGGTQAIGLANGQFVPLTEPRVIARNRGE